MNPMETKNHTRIRFRHFEYSNRSSSIHLIYVLAGLMFTSYTLQAQVYKDYIGAGQSEGVIVTSSSDFNESAGIKTINGAGMDAQYMEATRFLAQATMGYTEEHVEEVLEMGIEGWIDHQVEIPPSSYTEVIYELLERFKENFYQYADREPTEPELFHLNYPRGPHFSYAWWDLNMNNEDLLLQRVAFALSEIFVISSNSQLNDIGEGLSHFYDLLAKNGFGNFRDLLTDVTLNPSMGFFLSHFNNPKTDLQNMIFPDENYAREVMQLFTIGLYELNPDGTRKKDVNGNDIPTYGQNDIKGLAKVFTGLSGSALRPERIDHLIRDNLPIPEPYFGLDMYGISYTDPMKMFDEWHEPGEKNILGNNVIPAGHTGMEDIHMALDILFNHENVGPFIGKQLIQKLVKSNPSPAYIGRVTNVFNDNGQGVRGDLKAVVKAILMDEEARSCSWQQEITNGKLREPIIRRAQFMRSVDEELNELGYYETSYADMRRLKQTPLMSPTVFNFFLPNYEPVGPLMNAGLVGPEFQIHDTETSVGFINTFHEMIIWENLSYQNELFPDDWELRRVKADFSRFDEFNSDFESLINHLDKFYVHGRLSDNTRRIVREAINPMKDWNYMYRDHIRTALNLVLISPDYTIMK